MKNGRNAKTTSKNHQSAQLKRISKIRKIKKPPRISVVFKQKNESNYNLNYKF